MGKKIKPSSLLDEEQKANVGEPVNASEKTEAIVEANPYHLNSLLGHGRMTAEAAEKLEKYDALEENVKALASEKQMLEEKVTEYAEMLEAANIDALNAEIASLKKQLEEAKSSTECTKVKNECKALREEADGYLMKISELTFENANLTCQLNELKKNAKSSIQTKPRSDGSSLAKPFRDVYNPYKNNGYGTW